MLKKLVRNLKYVFVKQQWNQIVDTYLHPVIQSELKEVIKVVEINFDEIQYRTWIENGKLEYRKYFYIHKKALEFFFSASILNISQNDIVLDAAAGRSKYLDAVRLNTGCTNLLMNDHIYQGITENKKGIKIVGGDVATINLNNESVTKISCHHAIEHFQGNKDVLFIIEIARLLKVGGYACIVPIFITNKYVECWNIRKTVIFDEGAELLIDESASLPGGDEDGHFSRLYSISSFKKRILDTAHKNKLSYEIYECLINNTAMPDMNNNFGSILNKPLRLLKLTKR
ncbi:class I SAM-dependent methyltransferase [Candidatus Woesearchaeota archaeon]|nr:class I SAM-dependent methyltransferase [Candidatus Woesearchaeota archaeon]